MITSVSVNNNDAVFHVGGANFHDPFIAFMYIMMKFNEAIDKDSDRCKKTVALMAQDMTSVSTDYNDLQAALNKLIQAAKDGKPNVEDPGLKQSVKTFLLAYNKLRVDTDKLDKDLMEMAKGDSPAAKTTDRNYQTWLSHIHCFRDDIFQLGAGELMLVAGPTGKPLEWNYTGSGDLPSKIRGAGSQCSVWQWAKDAQDDTTWDQTWDNQKDYFTYKEQGQPDKSFGVKHYFTMLANAARGDKWGGTDIKDNNQINHLMLWKNGGSVEMSENWWYDDIANNIFDHTNADGKSEKYDPKNGSDCLAIDNIVTHHSDGMMTDCTQDMQIDMQNYNSKLNVFKSAQDNFKASVDNSIKNQRS